MLSLTRLSAALALVVFVVPTTLLQAQQAFRRDSIYVVAEYDPARNPSADLEIAVARARAAQKRILLVVGGDWCLPCLNLDWFIRQTPTVAAALRMWFLVLKVNFSPENENRLFLAAYPRVEWFPHIFVLESNGSLLHSQDTRELLVGRSKEIEQLFRRFLERWAPTGD